jgi:hypothetical protein
MPFWAGRITLQGIIMDIMNLTTCESHYFATLTRDRLFPPPFVLYCGKSCHVDTKTSPLLRQASECSDSNSGMLFESPSIAYPNTNPIPSIPGCGELPTWADQPPRSASLVPLDFHNFKSKHGLPDRSFPALIFKMTPREFTSFPAITTVAFGRLEARFRFH